MHRGGNTPPLPNGFHLQASGAVPAYAGHLQNGYQPQPQTHQQRQQQTITAPAFSPYATYAAPSYVQHGSPYGPQAHQLQSPGMMGYAMPMTMQVQIQQQQPQTPYGHPFHAYPQMTMPSASSPMSQEDMYQSMTSASSFPMQPSHQQQQQPQQHMPSFDAAQAQAQAAHAQAQFAHQQMMIRLHHQQAQMAMQFQQQHAAPLPLHSHPLTLLPLPHVAPNTVPRSKMADTSSFVKMEKRMSEPLPTVKKAPSMPFVATQIHAKPPKSLTHRGQLTPGQAAATMAAIVHRGSPAAVRGGYHHNSLATPSPANSEGEVEREAMEEQDDQEQVDEDSHTAESNPPSDGECATDVDADVDGDDAAFEDDMDDPDASDPESTPARRRPSSSKGGSAPRPKVARSTPAASAAAQSVPSDQDSIIVCGVATRGGDEDEREFVEDSDYFGRVVDVYTAQQDPEQRVLYRASALAHKFGVATNQVGMYLVRRRHQHYVIGLYQATAFQSKQAGQTGLKAGGYFVSRQVCEEFERYMEVHAKHTRHRTKSSTRRARSNGSVPVAAVMAKKNPNLKVRTNSPKTNALLDAVAGEQPPSPSFTFSPARRSPKKSPNLNHRVANSSQIPSAIPRGVIISPKLNSHKTTTTSSVPVQSSSSNSRPSHVKRNSASSPESLLHAFATSSMQSGAHSTTSSTSFASGSFVAVTTSTTSTTMMTTTKRKSSGSPTSQFQLRSPPLPASVKVEPMTTSPILPASRPLVKTHRRASTADEEMGDREGSVVTCASSAASSSAAASSCPTSPFSLQSTPTHRAASPLTASPFVTPQVTPSFKSRALTSVRLVNVPLVSSRATSADVPSSADSTDFSPPAKKQRSGCSHARYLCHRGCHGSGLSFSHVVDHARTVTRHG